MKSILEGKIFKIRFYLMRPPSVDVLLHSDKRPVRGVSSTVSSTIDMTWNTGEKQQQHQQQQQQQQQTVLEMNKMQY
jgi:hypothetical protein